MILYEFLIEMLQKVILNLTNHFEEGRTIYRAEINHHKSLFTNIVCKHKHMPDVLRGKREITREFLSRI